MLGRICARIKCFSCVTGLLQTNLEKAGNRVTMEANRLFGYHLIKAVAGRHAWLPRLSSPTP
jgi:hypothetical protein